MDILRAPIQQLGLSLFRAMRKLRPSGNFLFSPLTASNGFLLIYLGSDGATKFELIHALHIEQWSGSERGEIDLEMAFRYVLAGLVKTRAEPSKLSYDDPNDGRFRVFRINKIFLDDSIAVLPEYIERIAKLRAEAVLMPFSSRPEEARQLINRYIREGMNGRVRESFPPEAINKRTQIVLANGFCFRARWKEPFNPAETIEGIFRGDDGQAYQTHYMRGIFNIPFVEDRKMGVIFLEIPYMQNDASLLIFLPTGKGPLKQLTQQLTPGVVRDFHHNKRGRLIDLAIPKFAVGSNLDLIALFRVLGVKSLFGDRADLNRMISSPEGFSVALSAARHCGYFNISENGTDADESVREPGGSNRGHLPLSPTGDRKSSFDARSLSELSKSLKERLQVKSSIPGAFRTETSPIAPPFVVTVNRPFVFAVRHNKSGIMVCLSRIEQL
ncbi:hypothetical protein RvY_12476 [Ramazzottius varieornatus]|uniref:Serpin domain-containing protein n=1 Tax=Ramazzottius varieornatus TaxID=947166 RepID=A0A1D1VJP6_RAMVA|nr:hypothetical protein RvY_12476 [Ramazzottius varieornatus]